MRKAFLSLLAASLATPITGLAQPTVEGTNSQSPVVAAEPSASPQLELVLQRELSDAQARSRRSRNALIGTSATAAIGIAFIGIGNSQCQLLSAPGFEDRLLCNTAGDVLWPLGVSMTLTGGLGMIVSGIILGVSNKRKREIQRDIRFHYSTRKLRWDTRSGAFTF